MGRSFHGRGPAKEQDESVFLQIINEEKGSEPSRVACSMLLLSPRVAFNIQCRPIDPHVKGDALVSVLRSRGAVLNDMKTGEGITAAYRSGPKPLHFGEASVELVFDTFAHYKNDRQHDPEHGGPAFVSCAEKGFKEEIYFQNGERRDPQADEPAYQKTDLATGLIVSATSHPTPHGSRLYSQDDLYELNLSKGNIRPLPEFILAHQVRGGPRVP